MSKLKFICLALICFVYLSNPNVALASIFYAPNVNLPVVVDPLKTSKRGFITNIHNVNSKKPTLLAKWGGKLRNEKQEFGYLVRKYDSFYYDRSYGIPDPVYSLPDTLKLQISNGVEHTATTTVNGSLGITKGLANASFGVATEKSVSNSESITQTWEKPAIALGIWQWSGFWWYETTEYNAYTLKWDSRKKKFVTHLSGYKVFVHTPQNYIIQPELVKRFK